MKILSLIAILAFISIAFAITIPAGTCENFTLFDNSTNTTNTTEICAPNATIIENITVVNNTGCFNLSISRNASDSSNNSYFNPDCNITFNATGNTTVQNIIQNCNATSLDAVANSSGVVNNVSWMCRYNCPAIPQMIGNCTGDSVYINGSVVITCRNRQRNDVIQGIAGNSVFIPETNSTINCPSVNSSCTDIQTANMNLQTTYASLSNNNNEIQRKLNEKTNEASDCGGKLALANAQINILNSTQKQDISTIYEDCNSAIFQTNFGNYCPSNITQYCSLEEKADGLKGFVSCFNRVMDNTKQMCNTTEKLLNDEREANIVCENNRTRLNDRLIALTTGQQTGADSIYYIIGAVIIGVAIVAFIYSMFIEKKNEG